MPTAPTPIDPVPTPVPSTDDPANFDPRADAMLGWFPDGIDQLNVMAANVYANAVEVATAATDLVATAAVASDAANLVGDSNSTLTVGAGSKAVTLTAAKAKLAVVNKQVVIVSKADASIKMVGNVAASPAPTSTAFTVTVTSGGVFGSGTYSGWEIIDAAFFASAATAAEVWAGISDAAPMTPKAMADSQARAALGDASTIVWAVNSVGYNATVTPSISGRTIGAPTGGRDGIPITLEIVQPVGGGVTVNWNTGAGGFNFRALGLPVLSTVAGKRDLLAAMWNAATSKWDVTGFSRDA